MRILFVSCGGSRRAGSGGAPAGAVRAVPSGSAEPEAAAGTAVWGSPVRSGAGASSSARPLVSGAATAVQPTAATTASASTPNVSGSPSTGHSAEPNSSGAKPVSTRLTEEAQPKPLARSRVGYSSATYAYSAGIANCIRKPNTARAATDATGSLRTSANSTSASAASGADRPISHLRPITSTSAVDTSTPMMPTPLMTVVPVNAAVLPSPWSLRIDGNQLNAA
ncbi:hypothetical protein DC74_1453 [Streptomyces noursei]|nr:hypothetical protein DC74_1453 [Streptomyces noursei]